jgi:hypothetical protein
MLCGFRQNLVCFRLRTGPRLERDAHLQRADSTFASQRPIVDRNESRLGGYLDASRWSVSQQAKELQTAGTVAAWQGA